MFEAFTFDSFAIAGANKCGKMYVHQFSLRLQWATKWDVFSREVGCREYLEVATA